MGHKYKMRKKQFAKYLDFAKKSIKQDKYIENKRIKALEKTKIISEKANNDAAAVNSSSSK